jgi:hypothetical protein
LQVRAKYLGNGATSLGSSLHRPLILWKLYPMAGSNNVLTYGTSKLEETPGKEAMEDKVPPMARNVLPSARLLYWSLVTQLQGSIETFCFFNLSNVCEQQGDVKAK